MQERDKWLDAARKLDWEFSYVREEEVFPREISGEPWLPADRWSDWDEPFRTSFAEYVATQSHKDRAVDAVRDALGKLGDLAQLDATWLNAVKLHSATLPLAEFAATIGNLRAARFGRDGAWRTMATLGAMDELRHTQIPLVLMHELVKHDAQFDWTHRFYHSNDWVAIAARHLVSELLLTSNPIEFAIATNFVFETGFTNLQFVGLSALASAVGDRLFERMLKSIQSDEARHSQIGYPVLRKVIEADRAYAQRMLDKWFWRSFHLFAIVTGFAMDYLSPVKSRGPSFREFMQEWVLDQFIVSLDEVGLEKPWYWPTFLEALDNYHHMVYASAYTYRASVWFDFALPGPRERAWLREKYPDSWDQFEPIWESVTRRWAETTPGNDFSVHGTAIVGFCELCQLVLCGGTPRNNSAVVVDRGNERLVFCSEPCKVIFEQEPERYAAHRGVVKRVLAGEAPANLIGLVRNYFGLDHSTWGKDVRGGDYPFVRRKGGEP